MRNRGCSDYTINVQPPETTRKIRVLRVLIPLCTHRGNLHRPPVGARDEGTVRAVCGGQHPSQLLRGAGVRVDSTARTHQTQGVQ
eukprot:2751640-Pyramimonas_sp.AAC.1